MNEEDIVIMKEKKSPVGKIVLILFLFLILVVGGGVYLVYKNTTAENFLIRSLKMVNFGSKALLKGKENFSLDVGKDYVVQKSLINVSTTGDDLKAFNGLALDLRNSFSIKEEYMDFNAYLKQNDASLGVNFYLEGKNVYAESKDIGLPLTVMAMEDNTFEQLIKDLDKDASVNTDDLQYAIDKITQYIEESLTDSNTSTSNKGVIFTFKYLIDNSKGQDPFAKAFDEKVKGDERLFKILTDNDLLVLQDDKYYSVFSLINRLEVTVTYNALKREYLEINIKEKDTEESEEIIYNLKKVSNGNYKFVVKDYSVDIKSVSEGTSLDVFNKDNKVLTLTIYDTADDVFKLSGSTTFNSLTEEKTKDEVKFSVNMKSSENILTYKGDINYIAKSGSVNVKFDNSLEIRNDSVLKGDLKDAKKIEELTEAEYSQMQKNLEEKLGTFDLYKTVNEYYKSMLEAQNQSTM